MKITGHNIEIELSRTQELALFLPLVTFLMVMLVRDSLHLFAINHQIGYGDWLINYQGGFVRRGFFGEVAHALAGLLSIHPKWVVFAAHTSLYFVFFFGVFIALYRKRRLLTYAILLMSPVVLQFQFNDFNGGFRKEILLFALLSLNLIGSVLKKGQYESAVFFSTLAIYPLVVLSHEMLIIFLPVVLILGEKTVMKSTSTIIASAFLLSLSFGAVILSTIFKGDIQVVEHICESLSGFCGDSLESYSAIYWLAMDTTDAIEGTHALMATPERTLGAVLAILLVVIPFWMFRDQLASIFRSLYARLLGASVLAGTALLCYVACDWGRYLYILAVCAFMLLVYYANYEQEAAEKKNYSLHPALLMAWLAFCFTLKLPHVPDANIASRYLDYAGLLLQEVYR